MNLIRSSKAAAILGIHRTTLWVWVKAGKVTPALRAGDEALFDEAYIRELALTVSRDNRGRKAA